MEQRLSIKEVCALLAVSRQTFWIKRKAGIYPAPIETHPRRWVASQFSEITKPASP